MTNIWNDVSLSHPDHAYEIVSLKHFDWDKFGLEKPDSIVLMAFYAAMEEKGWWTSGDAADYLGSSY